MALAQCWQASLSEETKVHYSNNHIDSQPLAQNTEAYTVQKHQHGHNCDVQLQKKILLQLDTTNY